MKLFLIIVCLLIPSSLACAQTYLDQPLCFTVKNNAPYGVYGEIQTAADTYSGKQDVTSKDVRHTATFRLAPQESVPMCTTGPLYEGGKVRLVLRTLLPVFECQSAIYHGAEILIQGRENKDGIGTKTWAECL
jgi:hypothetical protein